MLSESSARPRDAPLRVQPLEVPDEQQSEVASGSRTRPAHHRVERRAQAFDERVEPCRLQNPVQPLVERMPRALRQIPPSRPTSIAATRRRAPLPITMPASVVHEGRPVDPWTPTFTTGCRAPPVFFGWQRRERGTRPDGQCELRRASCGRPVRSDDETPRIVAADGCGRLGMSADRPQGAGLPAVKRVAAAQALRVRRARGRTASW